MARWLTNLVLLFVACGGVSACNDPARSEDIAAPNSVPFGPIERCINLSNGLEAPTEGDWGYSVRAQDILAISDAGFDTVRLPVKVSGYTGPGPNYVISQNLLARLDTIISLSLAADLNIILDVHHFDEIYTDPETEIPRLKAIWRQLSQHYAGAPAAVIFEVLNEPRDGLTIQRMDALNREILALIRETNPERWVILSSSEWGNLSAWVEADFPREQYVISTFHFYEPYSFTHQGANWLEAPPIYEGVWGDTATEIADVRGAFATARLRAESEGIPVLVGEFGAHRSNTMAERVDWLRTVRTASEDAGFGWCHWGFAAEFGAYDLLEEAWRSEVLMALGVSPKLGDP
ncbi:MAG: glycoside hydrolase family 5 protein [Pseudomonadota bacterium]